MRFGIVEGEPGIFPDPIARVLRAIARLVRREPRAERAPEEPGGDTPRAAGS